MATTAKISPHGKEKNGSSDPLTPQQGRRNPKAPGFGSTAERGVLEKPTPRYLRATASSTKDVFKYGKKQVSDDINVKNTSSPRRRSLEKPVSQAKLNRTLSANPRVNAPKPISVPPKQAISTSTNSPKRISPRPLSPKRISPRTKLTSPKTIPESTSKTTTRILKSQPEFTKSSSNKKISTTPSKKGGPSSKKKPPSSPDILVVEPPVNKIEEEAKTIQEVEVEPETIKVVDGEEAKTEIPPALEETPNDIIDHETPKPDVLIVSEDIELVHNLPNPPIEETEHNPEADIKHENPEQVVKDETSNNNIKEESLNNPEETEGGINASPTPIESSEENLGHKLTFRKGKELEEKEEEHVGNQRLKFKEREEITEDAEQTKAEADNVVLKKQDVNAGKKESQAYNDVIEETRSKLQEKRKSKVLALAGAFETIISLEKPEIQQPKGSNSPRSSDT